MTNSTISTDLKEEKDVINQKYSDNISVMMRLFDQIETPQEARGLS